MKKYILLVVLFSLVLVWCNKAPLDGVAMDEVAVNKINDIDINTITDLPRLQDVISQISEAMNAWTLSMKEAQRLVEQLQKKYIALIYTTNESIENTFATIEKTLNTQNIGSYTLPLRAKKLWMIEPQGMNLNTLVSKYVYETDYDSTILVYTWDYDVAIQQAKLIAQKSHLQVSKNFKQAQSIAQVGNVDYISGLDIGDISKWIVYVNHELLDTNIDKLLSVSVDQEGILTIEATNYKQTNGTTQDILSPTDTYNNLRKQGQSCGENIGNCGTGLKCAYPCGIQGCEYVCQPEDELPKP